MSAVDIVIIVILAAAVGLAVMRIVKNFRKGGCGCGCADCTGCPKLKETDKKN